MVQAGAAQPQENHRTFLLSVAVQRDQQPKEIHEIVWYQREFVLPEAWQGKRVLLNFGAVDYSCTGVGERTSGKARMKADM